MRDRSDAARGRWGTMVVAAGLVTCGSARAAPDIQALAACDIDAVQFLLGGSAMLSVERQQLDAALQGDIARSPQAGEANCAKLRQSLPKMKHDPELAVMVRENARSAYALGRGATPGLEQTFHVEAAIMQAHDPAVALDAAHGRVVTQATLRDTRDAAVWIAREAGLPAPDAGFIGRLGALMPGKVASMDAATAEGFAHIGQNQLYLARFFAKANPARKAALFANLRASVTGTKDEAEAAWRLAQSAAVMSASAKNLVQQGVVQHFEAREMGMQSQMWNGIINRQMQQNVWQLRHPECAPGGSHPSSCGAAPILQTPNYVP